MTANTSTRKIYIVDDDEAARDSLLMLLEMNGFAALAFASAEEFLRHDRDVMNHDMSDMACLLLDLHMPGMNGLDLLKLLRGRGIIRPIIAISGGSDASLDAEVREAGATALLHKPFDEDRLLRLLNVAWSNRAD